MIKLSTVLLITISVLIVKINGKGAEDNTDCDPIKEAPVLKTKNGSLKMKINPDQFASKTCEWVIDTNGTTDLLIHLDVEELVIGSNDSIIITKDDNKTILYQSKGFLWPGVIVVSQTKVRVKVSFSGDKLVRKWDVGYKFDDPSTTFYIGSTGRFMFAYSDKSLDITTAFNIIFKAKDISKKVVLNLETFNLDTKGTVSFDGVEKYSNTTTFNAIKPEFLLSKESQINVKINGFKTKGNGILFDYELVDSLCSSYNSWTDLDTTSSLNVGLPDENALKTLSSYRCLNVFEHNNTKAKLLLDLTKYEFLNTGDSITVRDGMSRDNKTLAIIESQFLAIYWKNLYLFSKENKLWILFESPQVVNRKTNITNNLKIWSQSQGGSNWVDSYASIEVNSQTKPQLPLIFTFETDLDHQLALDFDQNQVLPGNGHLLSIYDANTRDSKSLLDLRSGTYPPDIMASNTNQLKLVFNQLVDKLQLNITKVSTGCYASAVGMSTTYTISGCNALCSWLIPVREDSNGTFVVQFSHMNLTKDSELMIERLGTKTSSVLTLKGPYTSMTFPDLVLDSNETYVLYIKRNNPCDKTSIDGSKLIGASLLYVDHDLTIDLISLDPKDQKKVIEMSSYPNYYPIGSDHLWNFKCEDNRTMALITFTDLDLSPSHVISVKSKAMSKDITDDGDLSQVPDLMTSLPEFLRLTSHSIDSTKQPFSGRGFRANMSIVNCGYDVEVVSDKMATISTPSSMEGISQCIWTVNTKNPNKTSTMNLLKFEILSNNDFNAKNLQIYDSKSLRDGIKLDFDYFNTSNVKNSSTNAVIIVYSITEPKKNNSLTIVFNQTVCERMCANSKRCLLTQFQCNGINDCGDFSDEYGCNGTHPGPTPSPPPPVYVYSGVNGWVVFLVICPLCIALGVLGVLFGPQFMTRIGRGRYREFHDISEVS